MGAKMSADADKILDRISARTRALADEIDALVEELREADREWVSVRRAAHLLDVSTATVYGMIKDGRILCRALGGKKLVRWPDIERIVEARTERAGAKSAGRRR